MLAPITQKYEDLSTPRDFKFAFYCDRCGKQWCSHTYSFSMKGFVPPVDEQVRAMLWNQQHEEAYERANREASVRFNRCLACGCRICDDCLYIASSNTCKDCTDECAP